MWPTEDFRVLRLRIVEKIELVKSFSFSFWFFNKIPVFFFKKKKATKKIKMISKA